MGSHAKTNGETASLKKRKREPKDEASPLIKRHRSKTKPQQPVNGVAQGIETPSPHAHSAAHRTDDDLKSSNTTPPANTVAIREAQAAWKLSKPVGGRMLDIDPIFSHDERHLILAYNTSIQVYTTDDSLLVRRIPLPVTKAETKGYIVSSVLSKSSPEHVWVTCTDGRIWYINWTTGAGVDSPFVLAGEIFDFDVQSIEFSDATKDVLFVLQRSGSASGYAQLLAYDKKTLAAKEGRLLHTVERKPSLIRSAAQGRILAVGANTKQDAAELHVGMLKSRRKVPQSLADLEYRFYSFGLPDLIACLDIRSTLKTAKKGNVELHQADIVVGGARGGLYLYSDVAAKLPGEGQSTKAGPIQPRKLHWHRKAVHSVKWSADGSYLVSGGYEQVLVLWQLDTGKLNFLPHLSGAIENIVVSPQGSSYAIHLDDNSTMVISTEEMKPTAYISGIQSLVFSETPAKEALVRRVWKPADEISEPLVAAVNPLNSSQICLCVGNGQQATVGGDGPSTPHLQVFDTLSCRGLTKYAIARTSPTDANVTSQGMPIIEPTVTNIAFSKDGKWLASVDKWQPPRADVEAIATGAKTMDQALRERREIYLKFWEVGADGDSLQLATRVNGAHHTDQPETIFDLVSDPSSPRFATLGDDGAVRFWAPKLRSRDGLADTGSDGQQLKVWACSQTVLLPVSGQQDLSVATASPKHSRSGALSFSEDGSILFAAFGELSEAIIFAIDTETGMVRDTISGMSKGAVRSIKSLGSSIILLSEDLVVYDIVSDELLYSFSLKDTSEAAKHLTQLAVNHASRSFAVAAPIPKPEKRVLTKYSHSELLVFSIDDSEPRFAQTLPYLITSVFPSVSSSGFIFVDAAAQLWSVTEGADQAPLLRPLAELGVNEDTEANTGPLSVGLEQEDDGASDEDMQDGDQDVDMDVDDDYDIHPAVVAPQRLAEIFNTAPAFAMPPIEDIFNQVASLFSSKPVET